MNSDAKPASLQSLVLSGTAPLSPEQKAFNRLIKQIEARRARLAEWNAAIPPFRQSYGQELYPLLERERALKAQLAERLDWAYDQAGMTKTEKRKLSALITGLTQDVLAAGGPDGALKALYNKHSQSDYDAEEAARLEHMKELLEDTLGVELGDELDLRGPEDLFQRLRAELEARERSRAKARSRRPSARQRAQEVQRETEAKQLSQSFREVYRKLASALHPDRETDPLEQQRKTEWMQQANEAYQRGNLLELLELQMRIARSAPAPLAKLDGQRLRHYLKLLKEQLRALDHELEQIEQRLAAEFGFPLFRRLSPSGLMALLRADIAATQLQLRTLQRQIDVAGDGQRLKSWLKTIALVQGP
ncbi:hypothetical protein [Candidatus Methylocalor cossyra]